MTRPKGRAIASLAILATAWSAARVMMRQPEEVVTLPARAQSRAQSKAISAQIMPQPIVRNASQSSPPTYRPAIDKMPLAIWSINAQRLGLIADIHKYRQDPPPDKTALPSTNAWPHMVQSAQLTPHIALAIPAPSLAIAPDPGFSAMKNSNHATRYYAYSFWRIGTGRGKDVAAIEFGSSQSGFIAEIPIRLNKRSDANTAILLRSLVVPDDPIQNELGIGARWRPLRQASITLSIEQRIRTDGQLRRVAYLAASPKPIKLSPKLQIHSYAQIGVSNGQSNAAFADMQVRVDMPVFQRAKAQTVLAPMAAMNVYNDSYRLDIGPSLSSNIAIKGAQLRLTADWRMQVAGNIPRRSGPTITLSSSF